MIKKFLKLISILFVNLFLIVLSFEFVCYIHEVLVASKECKDCNLKKIKICGYHRYFWLEHSSFNQTYELLKKRLRQPVGMEYNSRPILLMGCSFAYGYHLPEKDNLQSQLSYLLKKPVYNRAYELWWGLQTMLFQSRREDFYQEIPNPEFVVYVLIRDYIVRINSAYINTFHRYPHLHYKLKDDKDKVIITTVMGIYDNFSFLYNLFMFKKCTIFHSMLVSEQESFDLMKHFFIQTKKEYDKHWKNYKFIILVYEENQGVREYFERVDWKTLEKEGFIVVTTSQLIGRVLDLHEDVLQEDNYHPSSLAWKIIAPPLASNIKNLYKYN